MHSEPTHRDIVFDCFKHDLRHFDQNLKPHEASSSQSNQEQRPSESSEPQSRSISDQMKAELANSLVCFSQTTQSKPQPAQPSHSVVRSRFSSAGLLKILIKSRQCKGQQAETTLVRVSGTETLKDVLRRFEQKHCLQRQPRSFFSLRGLPVRDLSKTLCDLGCKDWSTLQYQASHGLLGGSQILPLNEKDIALTDNSAMDIGEHQQLVYSNDRPEAAGVLNSKEQDGKDVTSEAGTVAKDSLQSQAVAEEDDHKTALSVDELQANYRMKNETDSFELERKLKYHITAKERFKRFEQHLKEAEHVETATDFVQATTQNTQLAVFLRAFKGYCYSACLLKLEGLAKPYRLLVSYYDDPVDEMAFSAYPRFNFNGSEQLVIFDEQSQSLQFIAFEFDFESEQTVKREKKVKIENGNLRLKPFNCQAEQGEFFRSLVKKLNTQFPLDCAESLREELICQHLTEKDLKDDHILTDNDRTFLCSEQGVLYYLDWGTVEKDNQVVTLKEFAREEGDFDLFAVMSVYHELYTASYSKERKQLLVCKFGTPEEDLELIQKSTFDMKYPILKVIEMTTGFYVLNTAGYVHQLDMENGTTDLIDHDCISIFSSDSRGYSTRITLSEHERIVTEVRKHEAGLTEPVIIDASFRQKDALSEQCVFPVAFNNLISVEETLVVSMGKFVYQRNNTTAKWYKDPIELPDNVLLMTLDKGNEGDELKILCVTSNSVCSLAYEQERGDTDRKVLRLKQSERVLGQIINARELTQARDAWGDCVLLFFLKHEHQLQLFACSRKLEFVLLLEEERALNQTLWYTDRYYYSYYTILKFETRKHGFPKSSKNQSNTFLACSVSSDQVQRILLYELPEYAESDGYKFDQAAIEDYDKKKSARDDSGKLGHKEKEEEKSAKEQDEKKEAAAPEQVKESSAAQSRKPSLLHGQKPARRESLAVHEYTKIRAFFTFETLEGCHCLLISDGYYDPAIILLDEAMNIKQHTSNVHFQAVEERLLKGYLFAVDDQPNLVAIDLESLVNDCNNSHYSMGVIPSGVNQALVRADDENVWLLYKAANVHKLNLFGSLNLQLEGEKVEDILLSKQLGNLVALVSRFNTVSYYSSFTGKFILRELLPDDEQIKDASKFKRSREYSAQSHDDPMNIFDNQLQTIVSKDVDEYVSTPDAQIIKMAFSCLDPRQHLYQVSLRSHFCSDKMTDFFPDSNLEKLIYIASEEALLVVYSYDLNFYTQQVNENTNELEWKMHGESTIRFHQVLQKHALTTIPSSQHISPNGKYALLASRDRLRIGRFFRSQFKSEYSEEEVDGIDIELTDWELPLLTRDMEADELAKRVKFESDDIVRLLTEDDRDILFRLVPNQKLAQYLCECQVQTLPKHCETSSSLLKMPSLQESENCFEHMFQRNRLYKSQYWHKLNLGPQESLQFSQTSLFNATRATSNGFQTSFTFQAIDWFMIEKMIEKKKCFNELNVAEKKRIQLALNVFPNASSLLQMLTLDSRVEDQSFAVKALRSLFESTNMFADKEVTGTEEAMQISIPQLPAPNKLYKFSNSLLVKEESVCCTPFELMAGKGLKQVQDVLMDLQDFQTLVRSQDDVMKLLKDQGPYMIKLLNSSSQQNEFTRQVTSLELPPKTQMITFRSQRTNLSHEEIQKLSRLSISAKKLLSCCKHRHEINTKVLVKFIDLRWLLKNSKGFLDFAPILRNYEKNNLFQTELIMALTNEFWVHYLKRIILLTLIPWVAFSATSLTYFAIYLGERNNSEKITMAATVILLALYQLFIEGKQMKKEGRRFWQSPYNSIDLFQQVFTIFIVISSLTREPWEEIMNLCVFVTLAQGAKAVLDWLRLFDNTSFYVSLILQTLVDIGFFALIFLIVLMYVGIALYMTQLNSGESDLLVKSVFGNFLADSLVNEYLLILGEFYIEAYDKQEPGMLYPLFMATTFITQIMFLNMLIAIMSDTFDRVIEQRPTHSLKNKLMIMATMACMIYEVRKGTDDNIFLFVVQRRSESDDDLLEQVDSENWRGKLYYLTNLMKSKFQVLREDMDRKLSLVEEQQVRLGEQQTRLGEQQVRLGDQQTRVEDQNQKIEQKLNTMNDTLQSILALMNKEK